MSQPQTVTVREVLPKSGLLFHDTSALSECLCPPNIMPIKSSALERLEQLEREAKDVLSAGCSGPTPGAPAPGGQIGAGPGLARPQSASSARPASARRGPPPPGGF